MSAAEPALDPVETLLAIEAIKRLKSRYFLTVDTRDRDGFESLFTADCRLIVELFDRPVVGRARVVEFVFDGLAGGRTVHQGFMPEIEIETPTRARATWSMADYVDIPDNPQLRFRGYGHYRDRYERDVDATWRIAEINLTYLRRDPL
jgi:hypothetical protein